jgi:hypothetical protein
MRSQLAITIFIACLETRAAMAAESADALVSHGIELRKEGKNADALDEFRRAHSIAPSPRTLGHLGLTEGALNRWVDAVEHLSAALAGAGDPWTQKNHDMLERGLALARQHVAELTITGPAGVEVFVAGRDVGRLPLARPVLVAEGHVTVTAQAPGFRSFETTLAVAGGTDIPLALALEHVPPPVVAPIDHPIEPPLPPPPPSPTTADRTWRTWTGYSLIGAGAALGAWGITWMVVDGKGSCTTPPPALGVCPNVYDTRTPGIALTVAGGAAAAAGSVLLYLEHRHRHELGVAVLPNGIAFAGRF